MNRGQIATTAVIGWGIALAVVAFGSFSASGRYTDSKIEKLGEVITDDARDIASLQAQVPDISRRLDSIEKKLDILISNGIIKKSTP